MLENVDDLYIIVQEPILTDNIKVKRQYVVYGHVWEDVEGLERAIELLSQEHTPLVSISFEIRSEKRIVFRICNHCLASFN